jgi:O-antigen/teichoic acid export membrane protein
MATAPRVQLQLSRRIVIGNLATLFSGSLLSQGMTSLALLLTARQLRVAQYGQYAACFALSSFSSILFSLGMDIWLLREGSRQMSRLGELLGSVLVIKAVAGAVWFGLVFLLSDYINAESFPPELLRLSALSVWLDSLFATLLTAYKASLRNQVTSVLESGSDAVWLLATVLLVRSGSQEATAYVQLRSVVLLITLICTASMAWHWRPFRTTIRATRRVIGEALPFAASELLAWAYMRVDVLVVALTLGQYAAGLYAPAVGLVNALFLVPATVYVVIVPVLSNLFAVNAKQAWVTARRSIQLLLAVGLGSSVALAAGAKYLIALMGASYRGSQEILQMLSIVLLLHSISFGLAAIIVTTNQQARRPIVQAIAVAVNASLNLLIARWIGIRGVAAVYIATEVVLLTGYAWLVRDSYRSSVSPSFAPADPQTELKTG